MELWNWCTFYLLQSITSETISRQISRQTSTASTLRQISSIQDDVRTTPQSHAEEVISPTSKPDQKPAVMKQMCDAQTMTPPDVQQNVVTTVVQRQDSIVDERDRLKELRGVPIDYRRRTTQIEEVKRAHFMITEENFICCLTVWNFVRMIRLFEDIKIYVKVDNLYILRYRHYNLKYFLL